MVGEIIAAIEAAVRQEFGEGWMAGTAPVPEGSGPGFSIRCIYSSCERYLGRKHQWKLRLRLRLHPADGQGENEKDEAMLRLFGCLERLSCGSVYLEGNGMYWVNKEGERNFYVNYQLYTAEPHAQERMEHLKQQSTS